MNEKVNDTHDDDEMDSTDLVVRRGNTSRDRFSGKPERPSSSSGLVWGSCSIG